MKLIKIQKIAFYLAGEGGVTFFEIVFNENWGKLGKIGENWGKLGKIGGSNFANFASFSNLGQFWAILGNFYIHF